MDWGGQEIKREKFAELESLNWGEMMMIGRMAPSQSAPAMALCDSVIVCVLMLNWREGEREGGKH